MRDHLQRHLHLAGQQVGALELGAQSPFDQHARVRDGTPALDQAHIGDALGLQLEPDGHPQGVAGRVVFQVQAGDVADPQALEGHRGARAQAADRAPEVGHEPLAPVVGGVVRGLLGSGGGERHGGGAGFGGATTAGESKAMPPMSSARSDSSCNCTPSAPSFTEIPEAFQKREPSQTTGRRARG